MKHHAGYLSWVGAYGWKTLFGLIVPYFYGFVIRSCCKVGSVSFVEIYCVYWAFVTWKGQICFSISCQIPYFDCFIHGSWGEFGEIFRVESQSQNIVFMFGQGPHKGEVIFIVPNFDFSVIRAGDEIGFWRMNNESSEKILMCLKRFNFFHGIVVEDSDLKIITSCQNPMFAT